MNHVTLLRGIEVMKQHEWLKTTWDGRQVFCPTCKQQHNSNEPNKVHQPTCEFVIILKSMEDLARLREPQKDRRGDRG